MIFRKPTNALEGDIKREPLPPGGSEGADFIECPGCHKELPPAELQAQLQVCPYCRYHFRMRARRRIEMICDGGSFLERDQNLVSNNPIDFPDYEKKLRHARLESGEREGVVSGTGEISGIPAAVFVMESAFMMGSMGRIVGEKITRLFEYAAERSLPVVGYTVSGGARMQEGILSLMQMAKASGAVKRHSDAGNLYAAVLTDPTTGGVTASFAMEADVILAEPGALIGFAGPRVIEQTIRKKLPEGFQRAEFLLAKGFVDNIIDRQQQKQYLTRLLAIHQGGRE